MDDCEVCAGRRIGENMGLVCLSPGTKINFYQGTKLVPGVGTIVNVTLLFLSPFAPLEWVPADWLTIGQMLSESLSLPYNFERESAWDEGEVQSQNVFTAVLNKKFTKRFRVFIKFFGRKPFGEKANYTLIPAFCSGQCIIYSLILGGQRLNHCICRLFIGTGFGLHFRR